MKKILVVIFLFVSVTTKAADIPHVSQEVLKAFNATFIYAEDVEWQQMNNVYQASFWQGAVSINAFYDEFGNLLRTTRYYSEKQLPPFVVSKIKKGYGGKTILYITEVSTEEEINYYVSLQDDDSLYIIKVDVFGSLHQIHKYKRGDK